MKLEQDGDYHLNRAHFGRHGFRGQAPYLG
jgi:hypothetical protein